MKLHIPKIDDSWKFSGDWEQKILEARFNYFKCSTGIDDRYYTNFFSHCLNKLTRRIL